MSEVYVRYNKGTQRYTSFYYLGITPEMSFSHDKLFDRLGNYEVNDVYSVVGSLIPHAIHCQLPMECQSI